MPSMRIFNGEVKPPCTPDCDKRSATCHGTCKEYREFLKKNETVKKKRHIEALRNSVKGVAK